MNHAPMSIAPASKQGIPESHWGIPGSRGYGPGWRAPDQLSKAARDALGQYLSEYPWDAFFTITAPGKFRYPTQALRVGVNAVSSYPRGFVGAEPHRLGGWHAHGLVFTGAEPGSKVGVLGSLGEYLTRRSGGFCEVSPARDIDAVCSYVAKYVSKGELGEWSLTGSWGWNDRYRLDY